MADNSLPASAHTINRRTLLSSGATLMGGLVGGLALRPGAAHAATPATTGSAVTTITQLAEFVDATRYNDLPESVVVETRRILLDSIGCALGGFNSDKGKWGIDYARSFFSGPAQASVIGYGDRLSIPGAAFVNAELITSHDHDVTMLPGHVSPFVIPPVLAVAEQKKVSGKDLITACALAHELGNRIGASLGTFRDVVTEGGISFPVISGSSSCVFGGAAAVAKLEQFPRDQLAQAMGMAGTIAPIQSHTTMIKNLPTTTAKHLMAGWAAQAQLTAVYLVKAGHRGDIHVLDEEWGFWRFAGAGKWDGQAAVANLGKDWRFDKTIRYKAYPACGILRGGLDCLASIIEKNQLRPQEITSVHAYIEPSCMEPVFHNRIVRNQVDAQFSVAYNLAAMACGIKWLHWQDHETMNNPEVRRFMDKVTFEPHPEYDATLKKQPKARIAKVVVSARGTTFVEERPFAKGAATPDPSTYMTDDDLLAKFRENASRTISASKSSEAGKRLMELDGVNDISAVMQLLRV